MLSRPGITFVLFLGDLKRPVTSFVLCRGENIVGFLSYGSSCSHSRMISSASLFDNDISESLKVTMCLANAFILSKPVTLSGPTDCYKNMVESYIFLVFIVITNHFGVIQLPLGMWHHVKICPSFQSLDRGFVQWLVYR